MIRAIHEHCLKGIQGMGEGAMMGLGVSTAITPTVLICESIGDHETKNESFPKKIKRGVQTVKETALFLSISGMFIGGWRVTAPLLAASGLIYGYERYRQNTQLTTHGKK